METKRKRGRPRGSRDSKPRYRRVVPREILETPALTVAQRVNLLNRPARVSIFSKICGLSEGLLRKKVNVGEIRAFHRSGLLLIEPADFLAYWNGARLPVHQKSPHWENRAILNLARAGVQNDADRVTYARIAERARLLTLIPEDRWLEVEWIDEE